MRYPNQATLAVFVVMCTPSAWGCAGREPSQADQYLPAASEVVAVHGQTLDEKATPEQVAWALLMVLRDDVRAAYNSEDRREALRLQCRLADVELLREIWAAEKSGRDADALVFEIISSWAPSINFYDAYFDENFEAARERMRLRSFVDNSLPEGKQTVEVVDYTLPAGRMGGARRLVRGVTIHVLLSRTAQGYWRVNKLILGPPTSDSPA